MGNQNGSYHNNHYIHSNKEKKNILEIFNLYILLFKERLYNEQENYDESDKRLFFISGQFSDLMLNILYTRINLKKCFVIVNNSINAIEGFQGKKK
jgi:hypothetical protein